MKPAGSVQADTRQSIEIMMGSSLLQALVLALALALAPVQPASWLARLIRAGLAVAIDVK